MIKANTQYGFPISSILFQICGMIFLILLAMLTIFSEMFFTSLLILLSIFFFWYFAIYQYKKQFLQIRNQLLEIMIHHANIKGDERILDLGTGAGYLAINFAKLLDRGTMVGVDKYDQRTKILGTNFIEELKINFFNNKLNQAKHNALLEKQLDSILFIKSDLKKHFPFSSNSFDLILSSQFLYCIPVSHLHRVLSEIDRVLKSSGQLIFFESEQFFNWDITKVTAYFEKIGYATQTHQLKMMKNKCIFIAQKPEKEN